MGVKHLAIIVAAIVLIGVFVMAVSGFLPGWIQEIWTWLFQFIKDVVGGAAG